MVPNSELSSSQHFGAHVRQLPVQWCQNGLAVQDSTSSQPLHPKSIDDAYSLQTTRSPDYSQNPAFLWPTEEHAQGLLNAFLNSLASVQHLIDPRALSARLARYYTHQLDFSEEDSHGVWRAQMLLVFAAGSLLRGGNMDGSAILPGSEYFVESLRCLPDLCVLRKARNDGVSVMSLAAFYLQCSDRKDDAFVYVMLTLSLTVPCAFDSNV